MRGSTKGKKTHAQHHADFFFAVFTMLLLIVIMLLVAPRRCGCYRTPRVPFVIGPSGPPPSAQTHVAIPPVPGQAAAGLDPASGPVGTVVTIHGSGFGVSNTIEMNGLVGGDMKNVVSPDGKTLAFAVPASIGPNCKPNEMCAQFLMKIMPNVYKVSVITGDVTQDIGTFTVTAN